MCLTVYLRQLMLFVIISFVFIGCRTVVNIPVDALRPAKKTYPFEIKRVGVINASHVMQINSFNNLESAYLFELDTSILCTAVSYITDQLSGSPRFDSVAHLKGIYYRKPNDFFKPISWTEIDSLSSQLNVDGILAVEAIKFIDTLVSYHYFRDFEYTKGEYQALIIMTQWNLYNQLSHKIIDNWVQADTLIYNDGPYFQYLNKLLAIEQNRGYFANEIAQSMAYKISTCMAPYWETCIRSYFMFSKAEFVKADNLIRQNKWLEAAKIWSLYENDPNPKTAAIACYNMALVCEVQGKYTLALDWLDKSYEKYPTNLALKYRQILKQRLIESVILDSQLNIE